MYSRRRYQTPRRLSLLLRRAFVSRLAYASRQKYVIYIRHAYCHASYMRTTTHIGRISYR